MMHSFFISLFNFSLLVALGIWKILPLFKDWVNQRFSAFEVQKSTFLGQQEKALKRLRKVAQQQQSYAQTLLELEQKKKVEIEKIEKELFIVFQKQKDSLEVESRAKLEDLKNDSQNQWIGEWGLECIQEAEKLITGDHREYWMKKAFEEMSLSAKKVSV